MKRKFVINLALVLFLNLLVKPFWIFGIDRTVQNVVGADGARRRMLSRLCFLFVAYLADGISSSTVHFPSASGSQSAAIAAVVQDVVDVELQISYHG